MDVNIYGSSAAARLIGNHENTEVGEFMRDYLELDLDVITRKLHEAGAVSGASGEPEGVGDWLGSLPENEKGLDHLDEYHGNF